MGLATNVASFVLIVILEALLLHVAALLVLRGSQLWRAFVVALAGALVARLVILLPHNLQVVGYIAVFAAWVGLVSAIYRTTWVRAIVVGLFAYVLWAVATFIVEFDWTRPFR